MHKVIFYFLLFVAQTCVAEYKFNLSICAIFRDEAPYLKEWIEFHRLIGVEHFYLYNHKSQDNYEAILQPYIQNGTVELINKNDEAETLKLFNALQCKCYTNCLKQAKGVSKWIAFIDIDEFLVPVKDQSLQDLLKSYEEFGGVGVNWLMFGTSHIWKIPSTQLLIESLTSCADRKFTGNRYVKSIVRPERVLNFTNPHHPIYIDGFEEVNTDKLPIEGMWSSYYQIDKIRINHYWTRDGEFFYRQKVLRHKNWRGDPDPQAIKNFIQNMNAQHDTLILRYVPALKKAIENSK